MGMWSLVLCLYGGVTVFNLWVLSPFSIIVTAIVEAAYWIIRVLVAIGFADFLGMTPAEKAGLDDDGPN